MQSRFVVVEEPDHARWRVADMVLSVESRRHQFALTLRVGRRVTIPKNEKLDRTIVKIQPRRLTNELSRVYIRDFDCD